LQPKNIAIIIAVYKDKEALELIIKSILNQTILPNEIIIAEDGNCQNMKNYIDSIEVDNIKIRHTSQIDNGWQRNSSINNALRIAESEYLIFIDGDCLAHHKMVQSHQKLAEKKTVLCGRRSNLGVLYSKLLRENQIDIAKYINSYLKSFIKINKDVIDHYEEGIYLNPDNWLFNFINSKFRKDSHILGCHWSIWRCDIEMINGFDEDFKIPTVGEDTDIERRLRHFDFKFKSCRNAAIVYHLYHKKVFNNEQNKKAIKLMNSKKDIFICKNGLRTF